MAKKMLVLEGLPDNFASVRPKLNLYFKNKRKSGGEVLQILDDPDDSRKALLVYDQQEDFMKVLHNKIHRVDFKEKGIVDLTVKMYGETFSTNYNETINTPIPHSSTGLQQDNLSSIKGSMKRSQGIQSYCNTKRRKDIEPVTDSASWETQSLQSYVIKYSEGSRNDNQSTASTLCGSESNDNSDHKVILLATSTGPIRDNLLQLYFKRFSDHIEITKHDENRWLLWLMNQSDASKVLAVQEHDVAGTSLTVKVYDAEASEDKLDPRRFILSGFSTSCKHSLISLYINSCSKGAKHAWEILNEASKLVVTFKEDIDVKSFLKECSMNRLEDMEIRVSRLERTDSVLVRGEMGSIPEEALQLYFESKRSKGGEIASLRWVNRANSVILTFEDWHVAYRVVEEKHCLCNVNLTALLFYCNLQKALTGEIPSLPTCSVRTTLSVDSLGLHNLRANKRFTEQLEQTLQDSHASICINKNQEDSAISLEMLVDCDTLLVYHVAPGWDRRARTAVENLLRRYSVVQLVADSEVWEKIRDKCLELSSDDISISYDSSRAAILLAGQQSEAKRVEETVGLIVKAAAAELAIKKNTIETTISLNIKEELDFVWNMVSTRLHDVESSKDERNLSIHLKGLKDKVDLAETIVKNAKMNLIIRSLNVSPHVMKFLMSLDLKKFEEDHFAQNCISAVILNCGDACQILAEKKDSFIAEKEIMNVLTEEVVELTPDQVVVTKDENWKRFIGGLKEDASTYVNVLNASIFQNDKSVIVTGFSSAVADIARKLKEYLNNKVPTTKRVFLKSVQDLELLNECFKLQEVRDIKALDVTITTLSFPCLQVTAASDKIQQAVAAVNRQLSLIVMEQHTFSKAGEVQVLKEKESALQNQGKAFGCKVYFSLRYSYTVAGGIMLTVAQGDVSHQRADVVVCPLVNLAFDNPIASEILKMGGPQVQDACDKFAKEKNSLQAEDVFVLSWPGHLSVKTVIYAAVPVWGNNHQAQDTAQLKSAILKCLGSAEEKQCISIAMPILFSTFSVPLGENCKAIIDAIFEFCESQQGRPKTLQNIYVFDPKIKTVEEFSDIVKNMDSTRTVLKQPRPSMLPADKGMKTPPSTPPKFGANQRILIRSTLVILKKGDITKEAVDAIVNSTNSSLNLNTGVSGAILKAAGKSVTDECSKLGAQKADGVVITGGGDLKCKHIIQMVGPTSAKNITTSILKVLQLCESKGCGTVSIPAIGTGKGNISASQSIEAILQGLETHTSTTTSCIKTVFIVAFEQQVFDSLCEYFTERNKLPCQSKKEIRPIFHSFLGLSAKVQPGQKQLPANKALSDSEVKIRGVRLMVKKGNITTETVKGIVNITNKELNLNMGVSGAVLGAAGKSVENECKSLGPQGVDGVVVTSGGSLQCDFIIHMVGPHSVAAVTSQVERVLEQCEKKQITTVSFPAVGTGRGGLKAADVIIAMLQGLDNHLSRQASTVLKLVYIVNDQDQVQQEFLQGIKQWKMQITVNETSPEDEEDQSGISSEEEEQDQPNGTSEVILGPIKVKLLCGDITKETTDAIVNSTNTSLDLNSGVSGAILKAAGKSVVDECKTLGVQPSDGVVITKPGSLQVKHIVHMVGQTDVKEITKSMCKVLKTCNGIQVQSVSFPALGTGAGNLAANQVAEAMVEAIKTFFTDIPKPCITTVHIVIFQPKMMSSFEEVLKKNKTITPRTADPAQNLAKTQTVPSSHCKKSKLLDLISVLGTVSYPTMAVEVCGTSTGSLAQMKESLQDLLDERCTSQDVVDPHLHLLQDGDKQAVASLCHKHNIQLVVHSDKLTISGEKEGVYKAILEIKDLLQKAKERKNRKHEEKRIRKTVRWEKVKLEQWSAFDSNINYKLEVAYCNKEKSFVYTVNGETFKVDLEKMQEIDSKGNAFRIRRTPLLGDSDTAVIQTPPHWTTMNGKNQVIVPLPPTSEEFQKISKEFIQSCQKYEQDQNKKIQVIQIDRIQNEEQWQRYVVRKQALDKKYPKSQNEQILYHGTTKDICQKINTNGFNRSFCGRNATKYGHGTYFAKKAYYSCYDTYSNPDASGQKYIYRARVLTGKPCLGRGDMKEPDALDPSNPFAGLHDCAIDNVQNPFIFVIFCDSGAYPEYLITFKSI